MEKNNRKIVNSIIVIIALSSLSCQTLSSFFISDEQEVDIGAQLKAQIIADTLQYPLYKNSPGSKNSVVRYIDSIGSLLAQIQDDRDTLQFTFEIIDDTVINAFAIPGGHVFIYKGLLLAADNGAEVAGVLAHEIGHITKYHSRQLLVGQGIVGTVQQVLFGDSSSIASAVTSLLANLTFLKFSRNNEFEADSCAVAYTAKAGINPRGMKSFLEKLRTLDPEGKIFEPLSTHPDITERIAKVQDIINSSKNAPVEGERMYGSEYLKIRAQLQ